MNDSCTRILSFALHVRGVVRRIASARLDRKIVVMQTTPIYLRGTNGRRERRKMYGPADTAGH